tara:strand:+ start:1620 stop:2615 length:996 start_codon:yes stop_codon:yes gene_type:complete
MARIGITYEEVELTAEHLLQEGVEPTIERIRFTLGTGSNTTISKYLKEWRSVRLKANPNILPALKTPPDPVNQAVARVWQQLQEENEAKIKEIEAAANQRIDEANSEKAFAIEEKEQLIADSQDLRNLLKESRQQNAELEKKQIDINQKYAALEAKLLAIEEAYSSFKQWANDAVSNIDNKSEKLIAELQSQLKDLEVNKNETISNIKENSEESRHKYIAEIDALKVEKQKLQQQIVNKEEIIKDFSKKVEGMMLQISNGQKTAEYFSSNLIEDNKQLENNLNNSAMKLEKNLQANMQHIISTINKMMQRYFDEITLQLQTEKEVAVELAT